MDIVFLTYIMFVNIVYRILFLSVTPRLQTVISNNVYSIYPPNRGRRGSNKIAGRLYDIVLFGNGFFNAIDYIINIIV